MRTTITVVRFLLARLLVAREASAKCSSKFVRKPDGAETKIVRAMRRLGHYGSLHSVKHFLSEVGHWAMSSTARSSERDLRD